MRVRRVVPTVTALVIAIAGISLTGGGGFALASPSGVRLELAQRAYRPQPTLSKQQILKLAEQAAGEDRGPKPALIQHAAGTRFEAVLISSGDLMLEYDWSYLIAVRGHFTAVNASYPPGAKPPMGTVLTLVVDARTGQVTDGGIGNRYPQLAKLGPVTTDLQAPA